MVKREEKKSNWRYSMSPSSKFYLQFYNKYKNSEKKKKLPLTSISQFEWALHVQYEAASLNVLSLVIVPGT